MDFIPHLPIPGAKYPPATSAATLRAVGASDERPPMGSILLKLASDAHITHIEQPTLSYATHEALGDLYEAVTPLADEIAELCQGYYGHAPLSYSASCIGSKSEEIVRYLNDTYQLLEGAKSGLPSFIANLVDEVQAHVVRCVYKLKFAR